MKFLYNTSFILIFYLIFILIKIQTILFQILQIRIWLPKKQKTLLFLENFPVENAGYQYRAKKWSNIFQDKGIKTKVLSTTKNKLKFENQIENHFKYFLIRTTILRFFQILSTVRYKKIIVRRELLLYNDYGNLFMEKLLFSLHKKENIYLDFDDDISYAKQEPRKITPFGKFLLEHYSKFKQTLKLYKNFIVCSKYLKNYVLNNNHQAKVEIIPTCIEISTERKTYKELKSPVKIGWIGGNGNQKYLDDIIEDLNIVNKKYPIHLIIISGKKYTNTKADFQIENIKWQLNTQNHDLLKIDIGIMPLRNTNEDKGKCAFKLLQYMSVGVVAVSSSVTINNEIIDEKKNGFLVRDSWSKTLLYVIEKHKDFDKIGQNAYETISKKYTFIANQEKYINFIKCVE
jgi:glycosyltransferase involved in cell wall biosynthesis